MAIDKQGDLSYLRLLNVTSAPGPKMREVTSKKHADASSTKDPPFTHASKTHSTKLAPHQSVLTGEWLKSTGDLRLKPRITTFQRSRGIKSHTRRRGWSSGWIPGYLSNRLVVTTANLGYLAKKKKTFSWWVCGEKIWIYSTMSHKSKKTKSIGNH